VSGLVALALTALLSALTLVVRHGLAHARFNAQMRARPGLNAGQIAGFLNDYRMDEPDQKLPHSPFGGRRLQ
jgi:hypothetical protein